MPDKLRLLTKALVNLPRILLILMRNRGRYTAHSLNLTDYLDLIDFLIPADDSTTRFYEIFLRQKYLFEKGCNHKIIGYV